MVCLLQQFVIPADAHAEAARIRLRVALVKGDKRLMRDLKAAGVVKPPHGGALPPTSASVGAVAASYRPSRCYI